MKLPRPTDTLAGCIWLPRILAKARLLASGRLPAEYEGRFCQPSSVDSEFLTFFGLSREDIVRAAGLADDEAALWFASLASAGDVQIAAWNHVAVNLGRPGFPLADRLPVGLSTTYRHLSARNLETVFSVLEADEEAP